MAKKQSLLWEIHMPGKGVSSYLFGTMHVRDRKAFSYYNLVCEKIDSCEAFATEFDFRTTDPLAATQAMSLPPGYSLDQFIRPKVYQKIRRQFLKAVDLDLNQFRYNQPVLFNNMLAGQILAKDMPFSLDEELWKYADQQGKQLLGIETFAEQLGIMQAIPLKDQVKALVWTGKHFTRFRHQLLQTVALYERGDLRQLHRAAKKSLHGLRKVLLYQRNERMADRIIELMQEQSLVAAIGAGHLTGGKGVLRLLKQRGCRIKPVNAPE